MAHARLAVGLRGDEAQNAKADGIRKRLQRHGKLAGVLVAKGTEDHGGTARGNFRHIGILTYFDMRRKIDKRRYPETAARKGEDHKGTHPMPNTFHVAVYVHSIPEAVEQYRKLLGIEPAKVRHDYAKFELPDPPVIFSLNTGGEPGTLSHLGVRYGDTGQVASEMVRVKQTDVPLLQQGETTCCYAKADKFWVKDADGIAWEMYTLLEDVEAETAADRPLRAFLGQEHGDSAEENPADACASPNCCVPKELSNSPDA